MAITATRYAIFAGCNLNSVPGLSVYSITPPGQSQRSLNIFELARQHGRKVSSAFYQKNTISIGIYITATVRETLEQALDLLYTKLQTIEGSLVVPMSGGTARSYTATYSSTTINDTKGGYADLTLIFECSDSYGYDQFFTPMIGPVTANSSPNQWNWTFKGGADQQVPFLQFYFTGGTLGTGTVVIGNLNSGQQVSITRAWSAGDLLQIDSKNNTVQVNGVDVAFTGALPTFGAGLQTITYSDNLPSRTYQLYSYCYYRWN